MIIIIFLLGIFNFENSSTVKLTKTPGTENIIRVEFSNQDFSWDKFQIINERILLNDFYSITKKYKNVNLIEFSFPGDTNIPKYIQMKFRGNCKLPVLFSKKNQFTYNYKKIQTNIIEINYDDVGYSKLKEFNNVEFDIDNLTDGSIYTNQFILIENPDSTQNISLFVFCLDFDNNDKLFDSDIMIHQKNIQVYTHLVIDTDQNPQSIIKPLNVMIPAITNYFVYIPWLGNAIKVDNLSDDNLQVKVYFGKNPQISNLELKKNQPLSEYDLIGTIFEVKNPLNEKMNLNLNFSSSTISVSEPLLKDWEIFLIVFGVVVFIIIVIVFTFCIKNKLLPPKVPEIKTEHDAGIDYPDDEPEPDNVITNKNTNTNTNKNKEEDKNIEGKEEINKKISEKKIIWEKPKILEESQKLELSNNPYKNTELTGYDRSENLTSYKNSTNTNYNHNSRQLNYN